MAELKVGVLSCSGEECLGGTISRLATRIVLEELKMVEHSNTLSAIISCRW